MKTNVVCFSTRYSVQLTTLAFHTKIALLALRVKQLNELAGWLLLHLKLLPSMTECGNKRKASDIETDHSV